MPETDLTESTLLRGRVKILQPARGFRASTDTVLLAAAAPVKDRHKILDIGCGVGTAGFCVLARNPTARLTGIDIQRDMTDLALQNAALNGWADRCTFFCGDLQNDKQLPRNAFDIALMNPPYQEAGTHYPSPRPSKALAHGEDASGADLTAWVKYAHARLKHGGHLVMVHRADRLDDIVVALTQRRWFGSLVIYPFFPRAGEPARRVVLRARKERYASTVLCQGMIMHGKGDGYSVAARAIFEAAEPLDMG